MDQGFVFCTVVGGLVMNLQDLLELLSLRRDKQHACARSFEVEGTVEVHYPVFRPLLGRGHLDLYPLRHKVCEDLRLDRLPRQNSILNSPSLIDHLMMRPLVSRLRTISPKGNEDGTTIL
jgi:hypothetical protein